jgi:hypothetical protein
MNRQDAKIIAERITNEQLKAMFDAAKVGIKDWTVVSSVNKGITKGVGWNVLAKDFDIDKQYHRLSKQNMIREFGEFLPEELKVKKEPKRKPNPPTHHDPIFD